MSDEVPRLLPLRVRLPYATEDEFIEKYGSNVGKGGVFVATRSIKPEGTGLSFEFVLQDGTPLLRGEGEVVKAQVDEGGSRAGMTVRFTRLDSRSKSVVDRILAHRSGTPLAATPPPPPPPPSNDSVPPPSRNNATPLPAKAPTNPNATPLSAKANAATPGPAKTPARPESRITGEFPTPSAKPSPSPEEEVVLGIDLGTTNSRAAIYADGVPKLVPIGSSRIQGIPSVVALDDKGRFLVGARAKAQILVDPQNTVFGAKRLLGRRAQGRKVRDLKKRFPYEVQPDAHGDVGVSLRGKTYSLAELMSFLLKELKESAQDLIGRRIGRAVVCVPAYFNDHQRAAMLEAGKLAGLDVLRIFNEPSAVALAFGFGRGLARKRLLVYDLGGGTFDASVVEVTGDDLEVISTGGDNFLGGIDFDLRLGEDIMRRCLEEQSVTPDDSVLTAQRIRDAAEVAKILLSERDQAQTQIPQAGRTPEGTTVDLKLTVERRRLEELTKDLVDRTLEVTRAVLAAANITPQMIDEVLLVGGQSRAPLVRRTMEQAIGRPVRTDVDAEAAVALGAAILGHALLQAERGKRGVTLTEVLSAPIGFAVQGGGMKRVLERNTRLPAEKTVSLPVTAGQAFSLAIFQGTATRAEDNEYLGVLQLAAEKPGDVAIKFAVSPDGKLELGATLPGGRRADALFSTTDASDEVKAQLFAQAPLPGEVLSAANQAGLFGGLKKLFGRK